MSNKVEIGKRLRIFADKVGGPSELSRRMKVKPQQMNNWLSGLRAPGNKAQDTLRNLDCDIHWLMTGETREDVQRKYEESRMNRLLPDDQEMLNRLHELNILTAKDLEEKLNWKILYNEKEKHKLKMVAEPKVKYNTEKKGR